MTTAEEMFVNGFCFLILALVGLTAAVCYCEHIAEVKRWRRTCQSLGIVRVPNPGFPDGYGKWAIGPIHGNCYDSPTDAMCDPLVVMPGVNLNIQMAVTYYNDDAKERYVSKTADTTKEGLIELPTDNGHSAFLMVAFAATATNPNPDATSQGGEQLVSST